LDFKGLRGVAISGNRNVVKKESEKIKSYKDPNVRNTVRVECKNRSGTVTNRGNWNLLKIIHKIPEQEANKARNQETAPPPPKKKLWALTKYSI
jgi:hypothetical protein